MENQKEMDFKIPMNQLFVLEDEKWQTFYTGLQQKFGNYVVFALEENSPHINLHGDANKVEEAIAMLEVFFLGDHEKKGVEFVEIEEGKLRYIEMHVPTKHRGLSHFFKVSKNRLKKLWQRGIELIGSARETKKAKEELTKIADEIQTDSQEIDNVRIKKFLLTKEGKKFIKELEKEFKISVELDNGETTDNHTKTATGAARKSIVQKQNATRDSTNYFDTKQEELISRKRSRKRHYRKELASEERPRKEERYQDFLKEIGIYNLSCQTLKEAFAPPWKPSIIYPDYSTLTYVDEDLICVMTKERLTLKVIDRRLTAESAHVLLTFTYGELTVLDLIPEYQCESFPEEWNLHKEILRDVTIGEVISVVTKHILPSDKTFYGVCFEQDNEVFEQIIKSALQQANKNGYGSLGIVACSALLLGYKHHQVAELVLAEVMDFSATHPNGTLRDIRLIAPDKETGMEYSKIIKEKIEDCPRCDFDTIFNNSNSEQGNLDEEMDNLSVDDSIPDLEASGEGSDKSDEYDPCYMELLLTVGKMEVYVADGLPQRTKAWIIQSGNCDNFTVEEENVINQLYHPRSFASLEQIVEGKLTEANQNNCHTLIVPWLGDAEEFLDHDDSEIATCTLKKIVESEYPIDEVILTVDSQDLWDAYMAAVNEISKDSSMDTRTEQDTEDDDTQEASTSAKNDHSVKGQTMITNAFPWKMKIYGMDQTEMLNAKQRIMEKLAEKVKSQDRRSSKKSRRWRFMKGW